MTRWSHPHSLAAGVLLAVLAERHAALVAVCVFAGGVAVGRLWATGAAVARSLVWRLRRG